MRSYMKREAFTLIEMIMVIVILGVVAMIGTDIIARMYQGYLRSQIVNELQQKTELALDQIAKRLQYRIKSTVIAKDANNTLNFKLLSEDDNVKYNMLEWIGYDNEGFLGEYNGTGTSYIPGWSGFIDLYDSSETNGSQISTKGSYLSYSENAIYTLSYGDINLSDPDTTKDHPAILFKIHKHGATPRTFGLDPNSNDHNDTFAVLSTNDHILQFIENEDNRTLVEQYYLSWSAYALVPDVNASDDDFNLTLHYNYQPWEGEKFNDANTRKRVIAEHVSTFRFTQRGNTVQIKLCIQDGNKTGTPIGFCKEKAVF